MRSKHAFAATGARRIAFALIARASIALFGVLLVAFPSGAVSRHRELVELAILLAGAISSCALLDGLWRLASGLGGAAWLALAITIVVTASAVDGALDVCEYAFDRSVYFPDPQLAVGFAIFGAFGTLVLAISLTSIQVRQHEVPSISLASWLALTAAFLGIFLCMRQHPYRAHGPGDLLLDHVLAHPWPGLGLVLAYLLPQAFLAPACLGAARTLDAIDDPLPRADALRSEA